MDARLRRLREAEAAATKGPWVARPFQHGQDALGDVVADCNGPSRAPRWLYKAVNGTQADAEFIAAARDGVPALLDLVDRLAAALEELVLHHDRAMTGCGEAERARALIAEARE